VSVGASPEDWRNSKRRSWRRFGGAAGYESKLGAVAQEIDREVVTTLLAGASGSILDLPCGAGRMSVLLAATGRFRVVSGDYSPGMLAVARRRVDHPLVRCDAFALPFADATFDRVLTLRLVFHYAAPEGILSELARILRPAGELVFDTLNVGSSRHWAERSLRLAGGRRSDAGLSFLGRAAVERLLDGAGMDLIASESRFLLPTRAYRCLPRPLARALVACERFVPASRRVLTYWRAAKRK